ncbi:MAG TPA: hypothetical protein VLE51_03805 [Candidatus Saccharimonadales bacterium]|nr:hypothetical protein [Candidatus Saccharimonadales bacterium]
MSSLAINGYDGRGLNEDPKELAVRNALDQKAYDEGYRSIEDLEAYRPDLASAAREQALGRFPLVQSVEVVDDKKKE